MSEPPKAALVTGGAKRVGRAIAMALADAGYQIAITYQNSQKEADECIGQIRARGGRAISLRADLGDPATVSAEADQISRAVIGEFGRLDVLVNNASIYEPGGLHDPDLPRMRRMWAIHVESPLLLCRALEKPLRSARGRVVNMLDLMAERPMPSHAAYCASKAAMWNLTLSLARELAPEVTVNGIAPGVVEWPADYPQSEKEKYLRRVPLGRPGTPADVAAAVIFFCRDGGYVTGQVLRLDGGRSLG